MRRQKILSAAALSSVTCLKAAALTHTPLRSSRKSYFVLRLHQQEHYEDYNFYNVGGVDPQRPTTGPPYDNPAYYPNDESNHLSQHETSDYVTNDILNTLPKTKVPNNLATLFTNLFPPKPPPQTLSPRIDLPKLKLEDLQKITTSAISGGKFVTNVFKELLVSSAKLAIDAFDNKTQEVTSYNDVCEFDDELCREIEEALVATESFKRLSEESRRGLDEATSGGDEDLATRATEGDGFEGSGIKDFSATATSSNKFGGSVDDFLTATETGSNQFENSSIKSGINENHFVASSEKHTPNKFEDYYKRSLEQQLVEFDGAKSKESVSYDASSMSLGEQHLERPKFKEHNIDKFKEPKVDESKRSVRHERRVKRGTGWRDNRMEERLEFDKANGHPKQSSTMSDPSQNRIMHRPKRDSSHRDKKLGFVDNQYVRKDVFRPKQAGSQRKVPDGTTADNQRDSVRLHITDEALAFARSLNLDVYEIYLSTRNPGSNKSRESSEAEEAVVTLNDVVWYCDRMRIGPAHRLPDRRHEFSTDEAGYTGPRRRRSREVRLEARGGPAEEDYHYNTKDIFDRGHRQRRSSVNFERRHGGRVRSVIPKHLYEQSVMQPKLNPIDQRGPRFRQHSNEQQMSSDPSLPVQHKSRNSNPNATRIQNQTQSSMSQLISRPERKQEYAGVARDGYRKNKMSTVSLAKLVQSPSIADGRGERNEQSPDSQSSDHLPFDQVSTNKFREPYQGERDTKPRSIRPSDTTNKLFMKSDQENKRNEETPQTTKPSYSSLKELSQRYQSASSPPTQQQNSAYYTNDALQIAEKYGIDLRNVAAGSDDPITAEDVKHYIESRKSIRANRLKEFPNQRDSQYIDNELTYEEFASYFDSETMSRLQQVQKSTRDTSGLT